MRDERPGQEVSKKTLYMMAFQSLSCRVSVFKLCIILGWSGSCLSAKILLSYERTIYTPSHLISLAPICETLVDHGHEVVILASAGNELSGLPPEAYTRAIYFETPFSEADMRARTKALSTMGREVERGVAVGNTSDAYPAEVHV